MAARKKLTEFEKRSKASKKGWKTRRKHVAIAKTRKAIRKEQTLVANVRIVQGKPKKPNPRIGKPNDELKKLRKRLKNVESELAEQIELSKFVDSRSSEYLHRDFSIAACKADVVIRLSASSR